MMRWINSISLFCYVYIVSWTFDYDVYTRGYEAGITLLIATALAALPWLHSTIVTIDVRKEGD